MNWKIFVDRIDLACHSAAIDSRFSEGSAPFHISNEISYPSCSQLDQLKSIRKQCNQLAVIFKSYFIYSIQHLYLLKLAHLCGHCAADWQKNKLVGATQQHTNCLRVHNWKIFRPWQRSSKFVTH